MSLIVYTVTVHYKIIDSFIFFVHTYLNINLFMQLIIYLYNEVTHSVVAQWPFIHAAGQIKSARQNRYSKLEG